MYLTVEALAIEQAFEVDGTCIIKHLPPSLDFSWLHISKNLKIGSHFLFELLKKVTRVKSN
jgi:hypothetical protein